MGQPGERGKAGEESALEATIDDAAKEKVFDATIESTLLALSGVEHRMVTTSKIQPPPKGRKRTKTGCLSKQLLRVINKFSIADLT